MSDHKPIPYIFIYSSTILQSQVSKWKSRDHRIIGILLYGLLSLHLSTFSQGGALDTDSENVIVGAITLSSVVVCWKGKDFQ